MSDLAPDPLATAVTLLRDAEEAARRTRAEADRYAREREHDADLLVAKARRLLVAAEERAAVIVAIARAESRKVIDLDALGGQDVGHVIAPGATVLRGTRLEGMLAAAISNAVDHAFHDQPV